VKGPAAAGLGAEAVRVLAGAGADVILCSRSVAAGQAAADGIAAGLRKAAAKAGAPKRPAPGAVTVVPLDLADLASVAAFVEHPAVAAMPAVHLLVLNAGGLPPPARAQLWPAAQGYGWEPVRTGIVF
jgi:NAD(P)-dependent dehydrogenase (short-subunit alcohol dehydrogenase family)